MYWRREAVFPRSILAMLGNLAISITLLMWIVATFAPIKDRVLSMDHEHTLIGLLAGGRIVILYVKDATADNRYVPCFSFSSVPQRIGLTLPRVYAGHGYYYADMPILAITASLFLMVSVLSRYRRKSGKMAAGDFCAKCFYDLTGNVSGRCPECGQLVEEALGGRAAPKCESENA